MEQKETKEVQIGRNCCMKGNKVCIYIILMNFRYQKSYINQRRETKIDNGVLIWKNLFSERK